MQVSRWLNAASLLISQFGPQFVLMNVCFWLSMRSHIHNDVYFIALYFARMCFYMGACLGIYVCVVMKLWRRMHVAALFSWRHRDSKKMVDWFGKVQLAIRPVHFMYAIYTIYVLHIGIGIWPKNVHVIIIVQWKLWSIV